MRVADQFAEMLAAAGRFSLHDSAMDAQGSGELFGSGDAFVDYFQGEAKVRLASFISDFSMIRAALQVRSLRERPKMGRMATVGD